MEKILYNRLLRPVLAVVMVVSLALGVASSAWPAARQSARIEVLAEAGITNLRTLSIAVTELGEDRLAALIKTPMQGNDFKKMSGLLTEVRDAAGYDRIWLTAQKDGKTIVLCDSSYRDTGAAEDWQKMAAAAFPECRKTYGPLTFSISTHVGPDTFGLTVSHRLARTKGEQI